MITRGVQIVEGTARPLWVPVGSVGGSASTLYTNQIVSWARGGGDGVISTIAANAAPMTRPFGVVIGTNNLTPVNDTTYNQDSITQVMTHANQALRDWRMQEGMWIKNDPTALVQIAKIDATSVLRIPIYKHATNFTAPTEAISTAGNASGLTLTCGTTGFDVTSVAYNFTIYCREGLNKGIYRITYDADTGTNAHRFYQPFPYTTATAGEKYVGVNFALGRTGIDLQTTGLGINIVTDISTNYYSVECLEIHLENAGEEYALVRFL